MLTGYDSRFANGQMSDRTVTFELGRLRGFTTRFMWKAPGGKVIRRPFPNELRTDH